MKRFFVLCAIFGMLSVSLAGCDKKKAETKPADTKTDAAPDKAAEPAAK